MFTEPVGAAPPRPPPLAPPVPGVCILADCGGTWWAEADAGPGEGVADAAEAVSWCG